MKLKKKYIYLNITNDFNSFILFFSQMHTIDLRHEFAINFTQILPSTCNFMNSIRIKVKRKLDRAQEVVWMVGYDESLPRGQGFNSSMPLSSKL